MTPIAVVIASWGRPKILRETLTSLLGQTRIPDEIVVCVARDEDFPSGLWPPFIRCVRSPLVGSAVQRNIGADTLTTMPLFVAFFDDDMLFHSDYLKNMEALFEAKPHVGLVMGHLLASGNISFAEAKALLAWPPDLGDNANRFYPFSDSWRTVYGANMCVRWSVFERERFDERLLLYSLMEDVDFGSRARRHGIVGYFFGSMAVHLRSPDGRISYKRLGFAEVMNPFYLARKGTLPIADALKNFVLRVPVQNLIMAIFPKERNKRMQRFRGNLYALFSILRGRIEPGLILDLE